MAKREKIIKALEIAIDMLDRSDGTALYEVQKTLWGWTDKEYRESIENLGYLLLIILQEEANDDPE